MKVRILMALGLAGLSGGAFASIAIPTGAKFCVVSTYPVGSTDTDGYLSVNCGVAATAIEKQLDGNPETLVSALQAQLEVFSRNGFKIISCGQSSSYYCYVSLP